MSALILLMWLASEQGSNTAVDQISASAHNKATTTPQVGIPARSVPPAPPVPKTSAASQLSHNRPSASAPVSGSTRKQGRDTHTEALQGSDNCDPQTGQGGDVCKQVIETRSSEFTSPAPEPLSAEQSLMLSQQKADSSRDVASATRKLANGEVDDSNAGLAASALGSGFGATKPTDDTTVKAESNTTTDAIVSTVVSIIQGAAK